MSWMYIMPSKDCNPHNLFISLPHLLPVFPPYKPLSSIHFLLFWGLQNLTRIIYVIMDLEISLGTWWVPEGIPNWRQQLPLPQNPSPGNSSPRKDRAPRVLPGLITGCWQTQSCSSLLGYWGRGHLLRDHVCIACVVPRKQHSSFYLMALTFFLSFFLRCSQSLRRANHSAIISSYFLYFFCGIYYSHSPPM